VLVIFVVQGKVPPATDLAIKMSRRHRCFPLQQVLRQRLRQTGEKAVENICLIKSWVLTVVGVQEEQGV